jgi:hypothetical protein
MSKTKTNELEINGIVYIPKTEAKQKAETFEGLEYKIIRTYSAGVHAGYLESRDGKEVVLRKSRRLYYWSGASTLSQLAMEGVKRPEECQFPCEVDKIILTEAIEIIDATEGARLSIAEVEIWKQ